MTNLDAWVSDFLECRRVGRKVVSVTTGNNRIGGAWYQARISTAVRTASVLHSVVPHERRLSNLTVSTCRKHTSKGPLPEKSICFLEKKPAEFQAILDKCRVWLMDAGLAEPDDAYQEPTVVLESKAVGLEFCRND